MPNDKQKAKANREKLKKEYEAEQAKHKADLEGRYNK